MSEKEEDGKSSVPEDCFSSLLDPAHMDVMQTDNNKNTTYHERYISKLILRGDTIILLLPI